MCASRAPLFLLATWLLLSLTCADSVAATAHELQAKVRTSRSVFDTEPETLPTMEEVVPGQVKFLQDGQDDAPLRYSGAHGPSMHATGEPGETLLVFKSEGKARKGAQQEHRLAKRFNEFVGKRAGNSKANGWAQGAGSGQNLMGMLEDDLVLEPRLSGAENARADEHKLASVGHGGRWKDIGVILKSVAPQSLQKMSNPGSYEILKAMLKPNKVDSTETDPWNLPLASEDLDAIFHLPMHSETAANSKRYAEFPGKRSVDLASYMKRWAEFPGKRSITPAMKRYAEFLGKRSVAIASGALVASLERGLLEPHRSMLSDPGN